MAPMLTRADLLRGSAGGGIVLGGIGLALWPRGGTAAPSAEQDTAILTQAIALEQAQAALYEAALAVGALSDDLAGLATAAAPQERVHVEAIAALLDNPPDAPPFDFAADVADPDTFAVLALRLENLAVGGFNAQVANLTPRARAEVARLISVDARHAGWLRGILGQRPAPQVVDKGVPGATIAAALEELLA